MLSSYKLLLINSVLKRFSRADYLRFISDKDQLGHVQNKYLQSLLERNKESDFGKEHSFSKIKNIDDFRKAVPVLEYEDLAPIIHKLKQKKGSYLTQSDPVIFEKTSGSTKESKYIPMTRELLSEIERSTSAWIYDVYSRNPALLHSSSYWSISPKLGSNEITPSGIAVGFKDDSEYFSMAQKIFLNEIFSVSPYVGRLPPEEFFFQTAFSLIQDKNLGLISVWSPTFILNILDYIENEVVALTRKLRPTLRENIKAKINDRNWHALWPKLIFLSCWTSGFSKLYVQELQKRLPGVHIQGKGLFMTEGIITIPFGDFVSPLLAYQSHFFEFEDSSGNILLPQELHKDETYIPIITTSGGLYRYRTHDLVRKGESFGDIPSFDFLGRSNLTSDLFGEKITESFLMDLCNSLDLFNSSAGHFFFAPVLSPHPHYGFFSEHPLDVSLIEKKLMTSHHYKLCRELRQLDELKNYPVSHLKNKTEDFYQSNGIKLGNIKHKVLDLSTSWRERLDGK